MLPNLSYPIPTIGRIAFGDVVENERGKRIPLSLNHFVITAQYKQNGQWIIHPIQAEIAKKMNVEENKITEIPVKVMFNDPSLTIRERLECYQDGRLSCASCGEAKARRATAAGMQTVDCAGAESCEFAKTTRQGCDLMARINLQIDAGSEKVKNDEFSSFILRTRGYNSARTIRQKLSMCASLFNGKLIGLPFILKLRKKSTPVSYNSPFYYVDLVLDCSIMDGAKLVMQTMNDMLSAGLNQEALESAVRKGLANGPFEDTVEEMIEMEDLLIGKSATVMLPASNDSSPSETTEPMFESIAATEQGAPEPSRPGIGELGLDAMRLYIESLEEKSVAAA